jgi:hypothetical protein
MRKRVKINNQIEALVREVFAAAVVQESDRFNRAVDVIAAEGDGPFEEALNLALDICRVALFSIHEGQRPDPEQLDYLANGFESSESWVGVSTGDAHIFLTALADVKSPTATLSLKSVIPIAFAMGGWLLAAFLPENKHWYNFLDEILKEIEASPGRS